MRVSLALVVFTVPLVAYACSNDGSSRDANGDGGMNGSLEASTFTNDAGATLVGQVDGVNTKLPVLPKLTHVFATENDDSASLTFDPVDGALDYRVYPLPADGDLTLLAEGAAVVKNGTYRCAGNREVPAPNVENVESQGSWVTTKVDGDTIGGFARTMAGATLGYVYTDPAPGLVPVYVLGEADPNADNGAYFARWAASRTKKYTTSESERTGMLAAFARDDGIAFYVPGAADGTTKQVYMDQDSPGEQYQARYYFSDGPEADGHPKKTPAFSVLATQVAGTLPLMRVFYANNSGWSHDELAVGKERFNRIYKQGDGLPGWGSLLWTGITGPTTLVVEALDTQCPYQGHISPQSQPSLPAKYGSQAILHEPYVTLGEMRSASATGEVFINGQAGPAWPWQAVSATPDQIKANTGAGLPLPKAVARSFVQVAPKAHPKMDFFAAFSPNSAPEPFTSIPCGVPDGNCFGAWRQDSPTFDQIFINAEYTADGKSGLFAYGQFLGELWVTFGDIGADTNGKYRLTAKQKGTMSASNFLHVTMEVDAYSTDRRYPQILISDQDIPVQYNLANGHTYVIQTQADVTAWAAWPLNYELQICNMRTWDVNNQCPVYDLYHRASGDGKVAGLLPADEVGEHASADHRVTFDVYTSTTRSYLFLDGQPYACADLPKTGGVPAGPVTVTWGDVLYHSAADPDFAFHRNHLQIDTRRHFDNLGFSSGVPAPGWDETRLPCVAPIAL